MCSYAMGAETSPVNFVAVYYFHGIFAVLIATISNNTPKKRLKNISEKN